MRENQNITEAIDRDEILNSLHGLREQFIFGERSDFSEDTKRHLQRGFLVRLAMLEHVVTKLVDELSKADGPLSSYLAVELSLLLNSFYLNIAGSLDNLAWALIYRHNLRPTIKESVKEDRRFAQLLNKDFLKALDYKKLNTLTEFLRTLKLWFVEIKDFRDPGAHRIPLFIQRAIWTEKDLEEHKRLDREGAKLIAEGNYDEGRNLVYDSYQVGTFLPIFTSEDDTSVRDFGVASCINADYKNWCLISECVLEEGFGLPKTR